MTVFLAMTALKEAVVAAIEDYGMDPDTLVNALLIEACNGATQLGLGEEEIVRRARNAFHEITEAKKLSPAELLSELVDRPRRRG